MLHMKKATPLHRFLLCAICALALMVCGLGAAEALPAGERQDLRLTQAGETQAYTLANDTATAVFYNITVKNVDAKTRYTDGGLVAAIVDDNDEIVSSISLATEKTDRLSQRVAPGETFTLQVFMDKNNQEVTGQYQVTVDIVVDETGESIADASALAPGEKQAMRITGHGDIDVFAITNNTDTAAYYNATIKNVDVPTRYTDGGLVAVFLDDNNEASSPSITLATEKTDRISQRIAPGETYYLSVSMDKNNTAVIGEYQLTLDEAPDETGESIADASALAPGEKQAMRITGHGDIDVFAITNNTDTAAYYNATIKNVDVPTRYTDGGLVAVFLDDNNEASSPSITLATEKTDRISQRIAPGETYYLSVSMDKNNMAVIGEYQLTLDEAPDETGETIADTAALAPGENQMMRISGHDDIDVFAITNSTDTPAYYNATIKNVDVPTRYTDGGLVAVFLDDNNEASSPSITLAAGSSDRISQLIAPGETFYLDISMDKNNKAVIGQYQISLEEVPDEAGETLQGAAALTPGENQMMRISGHDDIDVFAITNSTDTPAYYNATIKNVDVPTRYTDGGLVAVFLDDNNEASSPSITLAAGGSDRISQLIAPGETFYLDISMDKNNKATIGQYQISLEEVPDEAGETLQEAAPMEAGQTHTMRISGHGDCDIFAITNDTQAVSFYSVTIKNVDVPTRYTDGGLTAVLLDADNEAISPTLSLATEKSGSLSQRLAPGETFYLQVTVDKNNQAAIGSYNVDLQLIPDDAGDTPADARPIALGEAVTGTLDGYKDVDCLRIDASEEGGACTVEIVNKDIDAGWWDAAIKATIWDANENELAQTELDSSAKMTFDAKGGGAYYLRVFMGADAAGNTGTYAIRVCMDPTHFVEDEWFIRQNAACETDGLRVKVCQLCGEAVESETLPATGHTAGDWTLVSEAACTEDGLREKYCTVCYKTLETETLPALGHTFGEWAVTREATKEAEGEEERVCSRCGETETQPIEKLPKNFFERLFGG